MSIDQYSTTPSSNDLTNYFKTGMKPSQVKNAGWDVMADTAGAMSIPTAGGTANALTVANLRPFSLLPSAAQIAAGTFPSLEQWIIPASANTGAATFAPDGLAASPIHISAVALVGGELQPSIPTLLKWDGTNWNMVAPGMVFPPLLTNGALEATVFAANGNFTPKTNGNYLIIAIGGGGGGGNGSPVPSTGSLQGIGGGGGSGGALAVAIKTLVANTAYAVVIGTGGAGGAANANANDGSPGVATTFGSGGTLVTAGGGNGGRGPGPNGGVSFNVTFPGTTASGSGMNGGGFNGGQGGAGVSGSSNGNAGGNGGIGGGGGGGSGARGASASQTGGAGGTGGPGMVIVVRA